jgi:hypothetical protein
VPSPRTSRTGALEGADRRRRGGGRSGEVVISTLWVVISTFLRAVRVRVGVRVRG